MPQDGEFDTVIEKLNTDKEAATHQGETTFNNDKQAYEGIDIDDINTIKEKWSQFIYLVAGEEVRTEGCINIKGIIMHIGENEDIGDQ